MAGWARADGHGSYRPVGKESVKILNKFRYILSKNADVPIHLVHFITNKCNAACRHCFIFDEGQKERYGGREMSVGEIEKVTKGFMKDKLSHVSLTGGEIFLRDDIGEIARMYVKNAHVNSMLLATNGYFTDRIVNAARKISVENPQLDLVISLSVDDLFLEHDKNRNVEGLFDHLMETYRELVGLRGRFSINIALTCSVFNQESIMQTYEFVKKNMHAASVSCIATRGKPLESKAANYDPEKFDNLWASIEKNTRSKNGKKIYYNFKNGSDILSAKNMICRRIVTKTLRENKYISPCYAGILSGVLHSNGSVYPCELLDMKMGTIQEYDYNFHNLWKSENSRQVRDFIRKTHCFCTYECAWTLNILFNVRYYPELFFNYLKTKFCPPL